MAAIRKKHLELLAPYLIGETARPDGEWDMYCPLHQDGKRSAQINVNTGVWFCHAGCGGGPVTRLMRQQEEWVAPTIEQTHSRNTGTGKKPAEVINEAKVQGWVSSLQSSPAELEEITAARGIDEGTLFHYDIGWDKDRSAYTIPVRDGNGGFWNLRRYQINPRGDRRKIWSVTGMGTPRLYPIQVFDEDPDEIIICEGEWDSLITIQNGFPCVTRTASATTWNAEWGQLFQGKKVYLCHDADETGQDANRKVARALRNVADVYVVQLPFEVVEKHGKDLTDFWLEGGTAKEFRHLLDTATPADPAQEVEDLDPEDAGVLDSFDSERVGKPLRLTVTIKGKRDPGYSVPAKARLQCTRDAGTKCTSCPLNAAGGDATYEISASDPVVLELMESTKLQVSDVIRRGYGAMKCAKLNVTVEDHQAVEVLYARPSVDASGGSESAAYKNVKITSVGRHDTMPNNTVKVVGALYPDPRKQLNEFQAWEIESVATSLDSFDLDAKTKKTLTKFQVSMGQRPIAKLGQIARDLERHATKIYGRPEMHAAMDLVFHSVLAFPFSGSMIERGWLDLLVVGDTRTGKSEAAMQLSRHYHAGEIVSCESASFAGIVGGLQQYGSGKEWAINWGAIPINDRRLVVLDEISGLTPEEIASMSDVRSRGVAQLTKIQQEVTHARTRLIWLGNPRDGRMSDYTYGVQAIRPLIGNPEDIARFDLAMSAAAGEVDGEEINRQHDGGRQKFTSDDCSAMIRWVWSRKPEQVKFTKLAEKAVFAAAQELGSRYVEDPPLIQVANARVKVARIAVAMAARLFSTDKTCENVIVRKEHVEDAVSFLDRIYDMPGFGYAELSRELIADRQEASAKRGDIKKWLMGRRGLAKFLRSNSSFRRQDLEEIMNVSREEANAVINTLWEARMVTKSRGDVRIVPAMHELLREVRH